VAQQWAEERRLLLAEVQELRRENDRLLATEKNTEVEHQALQRRALEAEQVTAELREALAERASEVPRSDTDSRRLARLGRHIEELTADLERVQRKTSQAVQDARREERLRLVAGLGDVLDSIDRGLETEVDDLWKQGLEAIRAQFLAFLRAEKVQLVAGIGEPMDPRIHNAIAAIDAEQANGYVPGEIVRVERPGLVLEDGALVRPALVTVAR
jgi:molecular chaperone GrpE